jgi:iron complex transport system substrate-binding protein
MQDVRDILGGIGSALGQQDKTDAVLAKFDADLAGLSDAPLNGPRVALSYVNNYTSGDKTLAHEILTIAGFRNVASEVGISGPGKIPLEQLILLEPDIIITGRGYPGQSRAEDNLSHPALRALPDTLIAGELTDRDWACGTPYVLNAIAKMRELRLSMEAGQ